MKIKKFNEQNQKQYHILTYVNEMEEVFNTIFDSKEDLVAHFILLVYEEMKNIFEEDIDDLYEEILIILNEDDIHTRYD